MSWLRQSDDWKVSWTTIPYWRLRALSLAVCLAALVIVWVMFGARLATLIEEALRPAPAVPAVEQPSNDRLVVTGVDGKVRIKPALMVAWVSTSTGDPIRQGDVLQTENESSATITFAEMFRFTLAPSSLVMVEKATASKNGVKLALRLIGGNLEFATAELPWGLEPELLLADASVVPTAHSSGRLAALRPSGDYSVVFLQGAGELWRDNASTRLEPLVRFTLSEDERAPRRRTELTPPVVLAPQEKETLLADCVEAVTLIWGDVEGAVSYQLKIAKDQYFNDTVLERVVQGSSFQTRLPSGTYFSQVSAVGRDRRVSLSSPARSFRRVCPGDH